jgi:hypothetical protein
MKKEMAKIEGDGKVLSDVDRCICMNMSPEDFANYLKKHNIQITEEIFSKFKLMNRFNSFSQYIKIHREEMDLKVFLPGDKKETFSENKSINVKPITVVKSNTPKKIDIEYKREQNKV